MPRIRSLKPEYWSSLTLTALPRDARSTFQGSWNYADDEGRGVYDLQLLKAFIWPKDDDITLEVLAGHFRALEEAGVIAIYDENGRLYFAITSWSEHQHPERPKPSKYPPPPRDRRPRRVGDASVMRRGRVPGRKGREGRGEEGSGVGNGKRTTTTPPTPHDAGADAPGVGVMVRGENGGENPRSLAAVRARVAQALAEVATEGTRRVKREEVRKLEADLLFSYWAGKLGHSGPGLLFDDKRERVLLARLKENRDNVSELLYVADGTLKDSHLMGNNSRNRRFDGIETIYQDRAHVERLARLGGYREGKVHPMAARLAAAVEVG